MTDADIIERASGGALLTGTLHKFDMIHARDYTITGSKLLNVPRDSVIKGPTLKGHTEGQKLTFSTRQELETFESCVNKTEIQIGAGLTFSAVGGSLSVGGGRGMTKRKIHLNNRRLKSIFYSEVCYRIVPVFSIQFEKGSLELSDGACRALEDFCLWIRKNPLDLDLGPGCWRAEEKYQACEKFFNTFGSHANVGTIHLGGIFTWKSVFSGQTYSSLDTIESLVSKSLQAHVNVGFQQSGFAISASELKENLESISSFEATDIQKTRLSCTVFGHPAGATSMNEWTRLLATDKTSCVIIDRGPLSFGDHFGVWDIVRNDQKILDFYANKQVPHARNSTETLANQHRNQAATAMYAFFQTWIYRRNMRHIIEEASQDLTSSSYHDALKYIRSENENCQKLCQDTDVWDQFLKQDGIFLDFVRKLPNLKGISIDTFDDIWKAIENLLKIERNDPNLVIEDNQLFQKKCDIKEMVISYNNLKKRVEERQKIRTLLNNVGYIERSDQYLEKLKAIKGEINKTSECKEEWKGMLFLDDGISDALPSTEKQGFVSQTILDNIEEMFKTEWSNNNIQGIIEGIRNRFNARTEFEKTLSRKIGEGFEKLDGQAYHSILELILEEVLKLKTVVGDTEDWLKMLEDDWEKQLHEKGHKGVWKLFKIPIEQYMVLDKDTLERIINTFERLFESASWNCRNRLSGLTKDNKELKDRIIARTDIAKEKAKAMTTTYGSTYLSSLKEIWRIVKKLKKTTGGHHDWVLILKGDKEMTVFLSKIDSGSMFPIEEIAPGTIKLMRKLIGEVSFEGKPAIMDMITKQQSIKNRVTSTVCSIV